MALVEAIESDSPIHRLDPRVRLLSAGLLVIAAAVAHRPPVLASMLAAAMGLALVARLPARAIRRRFAGLNVFLAVLWLTAPLAAPGEGVRVALQAALKANAILFFGSALVSTLDVVTLGHALAHLRAPRKLVHLFLFTVRYLEVLHAEYDRLRRAMAARAFRPRMNRHTYAALAALAGALLARSLDRAERVVGAMKCRGFRGEFYLLHHFHSHFSDRVAGLVALACAAAWTAWDRL